ncbi:NADPH:quinone reductase [Gonapodya prolifera JEL478]|uniref:NADPH:quinone reductase n=1 Tax=Gonapodya prolifera (strain JEL478) TaxID=1344416 RepID=A0A139A7N2_GONPJ|nr:NADPH:quinone reductase [Gonapodya prolifera JEL478]|eukprot:KXS12811.1 NADPH:quinone reductase [Gonapodya prolifera JEL478]
MLALRLKRPLIPSTKGSRWDPIELDRVPIPKPMPGEVLLKVHAAALNHRDVYIRQGLYPSIKYDSILGSDCAGEIVETGEGLNLDRYTGKRWFINPAVGWESNPRLPEDLKSYGVLGHLPLPGTLAEYISVPATSVFEIPHHLTWEEAAAIPLAGVTSWRALVTQGEARKGSKVLIPGIGGGVALFTLQWAVAMGCEVWVTSGSDEKLERARALGATGGVNYKEAEWHARLMSASSGNFDCIIDSSSGPNTRLFIRSLKPGGTLVVYGAVAGSEATITMPWLWFQYASIKGTNMGSNAEFRGMIDFIFQREIRPVISGVWAGLEKAEEAFEEMRAGKQFGKVVVRI